MRCIYSIDAVLHDVFRSLLTEAKLGDKVRNTNQSWQQTDCGVSTFSDPVSGQRRIILLKEVK